MKVKNGGMAAKADRHALYEESVQDPDFDVEFLNKVYKKRHKRRPNILQEDFCGTAALCAAWVKEHKKNRAIGLDLHAPTMDYGLKRHIVPLGEDAKRVELLERNVLDGGLVKADITVAFNFSYSVFKDRRDILKYFEVVREKLADDGCFMLDIHGGPDAQIEVEEVKEHDDFNYVWEQAPLDAINAEALRYIHFRFPDGTSIERAFVYDWRVWTLPELKDLLRDAGFSEVEVYWEGATEEGEGDGNFKRQKRAENEDSWIAYVVGWK